MSKNYGPKTIDISVSEFDGIDQHEPIEPYEASIIAYRAGGKEGALAGHADVAGTQLGTDALTALNNDQEAQAYLADHIAACSWATGWQHMSTRVGIARSPRALPQLGPLAPGMRPDAAGMRAAGIHTLGETTHTYTTLLAAANDDTVTTRAILSMESKTRREVSSLYGEAALTLTCAETVERLKKKPELSCKEVQEALKAAAIELTPEVRAIAREIGTLPTFRALAETDSDLSRFLRINKGVPLIVRRAVAGSRERIKDRYLQIP